LNDKLVSVIIVNYNGKNFLKQCFLSLSKITYPNYEIILVDNNSSDDSIEFVKTNYPSTIIIKLEKNYGFAYPNNVGAKNAKGELLLFLNNDTVVDPNFMTELVNVLKKNSEIAICQSLLLKPNGEVDSSGDYIDTMGISYSSKERVVEIREILGAKGAALMIRKNIFEKLNGFDEQFFVSFEDVDLGWRTWIAGFKVVINPKSIVYHHGGQTVKEIRKEIAFHGYKNQLSMKLTNFEFSFAVKSLIGFLITYGIKELRIWFDYKLKGKTKITATKHEDSIAQIPNFYAFLKTVWWIFTNQRYLWKKRKLINLSRVVSTNDLLKKKIIT